MRVPRAAIEADEAAPGRVPSDSVGLRARLGGNSGGVPVAAGDLPERQGRLIGPFARLHELRGSHALEEWQCNRNLAGDKVHVDAPVERVFDHIKDPANFVAADPAPVELSQLSITPEGVGSTWPTSWRAFGRKFQGSWTRTEYVLNERIVDEVSTGATWAFTTTPDPAGTTLGLAFAFTTKWTLMNTVIRWALVTQDRQLDRMLANYKQAIQG